MVSSSTTTSRWSSWPSGSRAASWREMSRLRSSSGSAAAGFARESSASAARWSALASERCQVAFAGSRATRRSKVARAAASSAYSRSTWQESSLS
jgi:hypothetical protein